MVHQDVVLVPGKKAKVRVVEPDGLPAKGAIVEGASEGWEAEVVLEGNELDVVGLGGTNRPPRLVLARDATGTRGRAPG